MKFNKDSIITVYKKFLKIRYAENLLADKKKNGEINSPIHLSAGQEAISIAVSYFYKKGDIFFGNHRSHHHLLSLGSNLTRFFAEILCKKKGLAKGYGASMHLVDKSKGFYGSVPIVTGSLSIATGAAFALKVKNRGNISVAYLGDGATEEGVFHESLLFSGKKKLPILYVLENNEYSSNIHISQRQISSNLSRFAKNYGVGSLTVDGNDFFLICSKIKNVMNHIRRRKTPFLIEAKTYRYFGHVDWRDDIDVGIERSKKKLAYWKSKDPIVKLEQFLIKNKLLNILEVKNIKNSVFKNVNKSWNIAIKFEDQQKSDLYCNVYSDLK
jgi:TPP-dependent pyruvate/acetoin dehydrogenase alpha subunit